MRKILVAVEDYPNDNGGMALMYVHTRNKYYAEHGIDVTVLNFRAQKEYVFDSIKVIPQDVYSNKREKYDILVLHAANLKHHFVFLKKNGNHFPRFIFFYHGHEVLRINKTYSKPYVYNKHNPAIAFLQDMYDEIKLLVWRCYIPKVLKKSHLVFVSNWMYDEFVRWTRIKPSVLKGGYTVIYNCVGKAFEKGMYDEAAEKKYDFVTIRGNLDGSKYCIDIVNRLAFQTPEKKFLLIGKGDFFQHNEKAPNLEWRNQVLTHDEITETLQKARFALMPTRTDAQGLMMCEMAAFGIPVITSDIPVCKEVFGTFPNVYYIDNEDTNLTLDALGDFKSVCLKDDRYYKDATISKEVQLLLSEW